MDQCVFTQQNDKSGHAGIRKNLTNVRNWVLWPNFDLFNNAVWVGEGKMKKLILVFLMVLLTSCIVAPWGPPASE